jgi:hypothetical protein
VSSDEIERAEEMARRGSAAQDAVNEMGFGEVTVVAPHTIYLALQGIDSEGYTQVIGARTSAKSAQVLCENHAGGQLDRLKGWRPYGSGTWLARVDRSNEYYEVMAVTVTA